MVVLLQRYPVSVSVCFRGPNTQHLTYTFIPASSLLVGSSGPALVAQLNLVQFGEILLVGCSPTEIAFTTVMGNGYEILGILLA